LHDRAYADAVMAAYYDAKPDVKPGPALHDISKQISSLQAERKELISLRLKNIINDADLA
jgi:hypothetical protein